MKCFVWTSIIRYIQIDPQMLPRPMFFDLCDRNGSLHPQTRKAAACIHPNMPNTILEILLLLEKHSETDNGAIDQESSNDRHNHGGYLNQTRVSQQSWECWVVEKILAQSILYPLINDSNPHILHARTATTYQLP